MGEHFLANPRTLGTTQIADGHQLISGRLGEGRACR